MRATIPMLDVAGEPYERGHEIGRAVADRIAKAVAYYRVALPAQTGLAWEQVVARSQKWAAPATTYAPDLMEEIRGMARGADASFEEILTLNLRGEIVYDAGAASAAGVRADMDERHEGCTSFALVQGGSGDGHVYCGQNWDWRAGALDTTVVLRVASAGMPTIIMQVEAGQVGRHGANSAGIALNANGLGGRFDQTPGIPQTFIRRRVLESATLGEALSVLVETPTIIASNALVTSRDDFAIDLETTPAGVAWLYPDHGVLAHGNHYQAEVPGPLSGRYRPLAASSLYRQRLVEDALRTCSEQSSTATVRKVVHEAMSNHVGFPDSVCCHPETNQPSWAQWCTLLSSLVDLTSGQYFVASGNPCENAYQEVPWNLYETHKPTDA